MGVVNTESEDLIAQLENQLRQLQLGLQRTGGLLSGPDAPQGDEQAQMLQMMSGMQGQQQEAAQQLQGMGGDPMQQQMQGILMATQLGEDGEPDLRSSSAEVRRLESVKAGLLGGMQPAGRANANFQPSVSSQNMGELYSAMAGGADNPNLIGMDYVKRMQYNDMLKNQAMNSASQSRTSGFNPIVDEKGMVYFPRLMEDGSTGLTPANGADGKQIKTDPRFSTIDLGGGAYGRAQVSGGAGGTGVEALTTAQQAQHNEDIKQTLKRQQDARRQLPALENAFAREGGAFHTVSRLIEHPARELMTGKSAIAGVPWSYAPGTDAQEFRTLEGKLSSQAFINSIQELRSTGATVGQITEREGDKLQAAGLALNLAAKEGDYLEELTNFKYALARFMILAREEAGVEDPFGSTIGKAGVDLYDLKGGGQPGMTPEQQAVFDRYSQ